MMTPTVKLTYKFYLKKPTPELFENFTWRFFAAVNFTSSRLKDNTCTLVFWKQFLEEGPRKFPDFRSGMNCHQIFIVVYNCNCRCAAGRMIVYALVAVMVNKANFFQLCGLKQVFM